MMTNFKMIFHVDVSLNEQLISFVFSSFLKMSTCLYQKTCHFFPKASTCLSVFSYRPKLKSSVL